MIAFESQIVSMVIYPLAALTLSFAATWLYLRWNTKHFKAFDKPNDRGVHEEDTPLGGGAPLVLVVMALWLTLWPLAPYVAIVIACTLLLAVISWIDDLKPLRQATRFAAQIVVIAAVLSLFDNDARVFSQSWPFWADRLLTAFCWIWFINLFNFMDGIDGLAGAETIAICVGLVIIAILVGASIEPILLTLTIAGAAAGFLVWNWHPARLFLGDVGSIPLGFLLGWLLIEMAKSGVLAAAFILPLYFLGDATTTMVLRLFRGEPIWQPHRQHFYQKAVLAGWSHSSVVMRITFANLLLIALAAYSIAAPYTATILALAIVFSLFFLLDKMAKNTS